MEKVMGRAVLGTPVLFLLLAFLAGGFSNAVGVLGISIVCTAGLGLLVWGAIAYAIGSVMLLIFRGSALSGAPRGLR